MIPVLSSAHEVPWTSRTCSRCGREFPVFGRENVCSACRHPRKPRRRAVHGQRLSPRESQVVLLVHQDLPDKIIAAMLGLSEGTIKVYMTSIKRKLGVRSRVGVALWVERHPEVFKSQSEVAA